MGCGTSKLDPADRDASHQNAKIDRQLRHDKKLEQKTVKILLLGVYNSAGRRPMI